MSKFENANDEFAKMAEELYLKHWGELNLMVHPSKVEFLRIEKKKNAYAYCKKISGEYEHLTNKKFFIVIVNENYDNLESEEQKKYVILHELKHLYYDIEKDKYSLLKHTLEDFHDLILNPNWNLNLIKEEKIYENK